MEPTELLRLVGERLDRLGCEHFTTGSLASMIAVQGAEALDWHYLEDWAARLGITDQFDMIRPK